jgi:hypothetical protein
MIAVRFDASTSLSIYSSASDHLDCSTDRYGLQSASLLVKFAPPARLQIIWTAPMIAVCFSTSLLPDHLDCSNVCASIHVFQSLTLQASIGDVL